MTKKRFVPISVEWTDGFIQDHYNDKDLFSINEVCDLLNEQHETIERLKRNFKELDEVKCEMAKENEELKDALNQRTIQCDKFYQENEQLKQLIKRVLETTPIEHNLAIDLKNSVRELYD